ncbi:MAG: TetR/AcrR family transcriptional regulator [Oscillospiraceae bacterium]|nr:TetR/AcrR family transcriptional regulator [Oscillospiraceae bacterium]
MAVPDKSIDPRLFSSAKSEFLKNGFLKAELKTICENAGITTGALYKRYKGKEELFCAVVQDTVDAIDAFIKKRTLPELSDLTDEEICHSWDMNEEYTLELFRMLWEHHDGFVILISKAAGTCYEDYQHVFVSSMSDAYEKYYNEAKRRGLARTDISGTELYVLCTSFWTSVYEPVIHGMSWEEIQKHCKLMCQFFHWADTILLTERREQNV